MRIARRKRERESAKCILAERENRRRVVSVYGLSGFLSHQVKRAAPGIVHAHVHHLDTSVF